VPRAQVLLRHRVLDSLGEASVLVHTLRSAIYRVRRSRTAPQSETSALVHETPELAKAWEEAITGTLRLISYFAKELHEEEIDLTVIVIPAPNSLSLRNSWGNPRKAEFMQRLTDIAKGGAFSLLQIDFRKYDPYAIYSFDGKTLGHLTTIGHRLVAEQVHRSLQDRQVVSD